MYEKQLKNAMREFLKQASDMSFSYFSSNNELKEYKRKPMFIETDQFCAKMRDYCTKCFIIGYNFEDIYADTTKHFCNNFRNLYRSAYGFANVTLILLHELGHHQTQDKIEELKKTGYCREAELTRIFLRTKSVEDANVLYYQLPDEKLATNWAIQWLQDPEHRKIAKAFEKNFFKYLRIRG